MQLLTVDFFTARNCMMKNLLKLELYMLYIETQTFSQVEFIFFFS